MAFKFLTGPYLNSVGRSPVSSVTASSADSLSPVTYVYDGRPSSVWQVNARGASHTILMDLDILAGGQANTSADLAEFTASGTWVVDTSQKHAGAASFRCDGVGTLRQAVEVQPGEYMKLGWALRGDTTNSMALQLINTKTGKWLQSDGTWGTSANVASQTAASWAASSLEFQVESTTDCARVTLELLLSAGAGAGGDAWADELCLVPGLDFMAIVGHDLAAGADTLEVGWSSSRAASWSEDADDVITVRERACWGQTEARRYYLSAKLTISCTLSAVSTASSHKHYIGEFVLGQLQTLVDAVTSPYKDTRSARSVSRAMAGSGAHWHQGSGRRSPRTIEATLQFATAADAETTIRQIDTYTEGGTLPIILLPTEIDSTGLVYGYTVDKQVLDWTLPIAGWSELTLVVEEEPEPRVG